MTAFTARELRIISDHLEILTKARNANQRMGIPTTPDVFTARFHTGLYAVLRWCPRISSPEPARQRFIQNTARHRNNYQLDLGTAPDVENAIRLPDPWEAKRAHRDDTTRIDVQDATEDTSATLNALRGEHGPETLGWK